MTCVSASCANQAIPKLLLVWAESPASSLHDILVLRILQRDLGNLIQVCCLSGKI